MKTLISAVALTLGLAFSGMSFAGDEAPKTKTVCHDKRTNDGKTVTGKDGKPVQECKTIKVHKKAEKVTSGADPSAKEAKSALKKDDKKK